MSLIHTRGDITPMTDTANVSVFVSHSHKDDIFTSRLVADLRAAGADVWVDNAEINYDDFIKKINDGLRGRQWLILVLTPNALASQWVETEVNAALHQAKLGQMRGVIPLLAQSCDERDIPPTWATLHRYDATSSERYQAELARLLRTLGLSMQGTVASHFASEPPAARDAEPVQPKIPGVYRVDASGNGDCRTIGAALRSAQYDEQITIMPGTYREDLEITEPVKIIGEGKTQEIILETVKGINIAIPYEECAVHLANMTIRHTGTGSAIHGIAGIVSLSLKIDHCDITSNSGVGIQPGPRMATTLNYTSIHNCRQSGVLLDPYAIAGIEDCTISSNGGDGITIGSGALIYAYRNRITNNAGCGVFARGACGGTFENNDLRWNKSGAWALDTRNNKLTRTGNLE